MSRQSKVIFARLLRGIPIILGVTLLSFILMVYFGPDKTYDLLGKNPTAQQIAQVREQLGYNRPFLVRYLEFLRQVVTFDFGHSDSTGQNVMELLGQAAPISLLLSLPGFVLGNLLSMLIGMFAAWYQGRWQDRVVMICSMVGMSMSYIIVIILGQYLLSSSYGLNAFPVSGWDVTDFSSYLNYITVPTLCTVFVALGYNTRFFRAIFIEESRKDHVRTAKAYGASTPFILWQHIYRNSLIPIITRTVFSLPFVLVGGNLLIESYFSIPGIGQVTYSAITTGDLPVIKAVVSLTAILYAFCLVAIDVLYAWADPRLRAS
jgi:peptide/nickel transport system permease protein